jgi:ribose transport system permease protein
VSATLDRGPETREDAEVRAGAASNRIASALRRQEITLFGVIVILGLAAGVKNPTFLTIDNLTEIGRATVIYFVMACGAAILVIGGGLDFSVGSVFTLGGIVTAEVMVHGGPIPVAIVAGVGAGAAVGYLNSLIIEFLHVPPIITTLGVFFFISGLVVQITGGADVYPLPSDFEALGQGTVLSVPAIILYAIVVGLLAWFVLDRTPVGVRVRALGGNRNAAIANGLRARRLDTYLYVAAGAAAALGGIIYTARTSSGQVSAGGANVTLTVVTAVLIGGVSLQGGLGTIQGVLLGALLLAEIDNALTLTQIPPQYNNMVIGAILIAAVATDHLRRQRLYQRVR